MYPWYEQQRIATVKLRKLSELPSELFLHILWILEACWWTALPNLKIKQRLCYMWQIPKGFCYNPKTLTSPSGKNALLHVHNQQFWLATIWRDFKWDQNEISTCIFCSFPLYLCISPVLLKKHHHNNLFILLRFNSINLSDHVSFYLPVNLKPNL